MNWHFSRSFTSGEIRSSASRIAGTSHVWLALVTIGLLPMLVFGQAEETYVYPGITAEAQFVIGNINNDAVNASVTFYDGSTGEAFPHSIILQPGTQTRFTPESLDSNNLDDFDGSTIITSALPLAVTVTLSEGTDDFEHLSPADSGVELVIPFAGFGGVLSEIIVFNPGEVDARARLIQVGENGVSLGVVDRVVEPKETIRVGTGSNAEVRYIVVRTSNFFLGGRPVAAAALDRAFVPPSGGVNSLDLTYVPGRQPLTEPSTSRIPLFLVGDGFVSTLQVINDTNGPQTITLTARDLEGNEISGGNNPATVELTGRGVHSENVVELFDVSDIDLITGSIAFEGQGRVSAQIAITGISAPFGAKIPPEPAPTDSFAYQIRQAGREFGWLLNLINPNPAPANVDLTFVLDDGTVVSSIDTSIPASTQISPRLASIFPEAQGDGFVVFQSDVPLIAGGLELRANSEAASVLHAQPAATDFLSGDPVEQFAVGTVRSNGEGLQGVTVTLAGPQSGTTLTDSAGTYIFPDLSPGAYTLSAQVIGFTITPPQIAFTIDTEPSRENDFTATLITPVINTLTPTGATVGSSATEIVVEGGPFISGSVVMLGTTALATTVASSQTLLATVPASLMVSPVQLNLIVRNRGLAGDFVDSAPVTFSVGNPPPVLTVLSGQPNPLIAGSAGFTLTVNGVGFLPGVTIFLDQIPKPAAFISDTQVTVQIAAEDLAVGGFIPVRALNPGPAVLSNALDLVVLNPPPEITAVTPSTAPVKLLPSLPPLDLTVTGTGFQEDATILVDGSPVLTTFVSSTVVTGAVPAGLLGVSGVHDVQVLNPEPSQGPSFAFPLTLQNPVPILTAVVGDVSYDTTQVGQLQTAPILLQGSQFAQNSTVWMSSPCDALGFRLLPNVTVPSGSELPPEYATRRLSPNSMTATLNVECGGDYMFQVRSPQPGGGASGIVTLTVPEV